MPDTALILGGVLFQDFEIPESINFGGRQTLAVHKMIGGARTVDAMGSDQADISWTGRFRTGNALQRAQQIDRLRILGQPVTLSWGGLLYQVIISEFLPNYERFYEIPYRITCTPSQGETVLAQATQSVDTAVGNDTSLAGTLISAAQSAVPALSAVSSALGTATVAIGTLGGLAGKSGSQLAGIVTSLNSAQVGISGAISVADGNVLQGASQIGGVVPGSPSASVTSLANQITNLTSLSSLVTARGLIGRTITNVGSA